MNFWLKIQKIDRRWVYLALAIMLIFSLNSSFIEKPAKPGAQAQQLYDEIEKLPKDQLVFLSVTFSSSTLPENGNQLRSVMRHLALKKQPYAIISFDQQGTTNATFIGQDIATQYQLEYGKDYIDMGYNIRSLAFIFSFLDDINKAIKVDAVQKKQLKDFPIMKNVKGLKDPGIGMLIEFTASASLGDWVQFVQPKTKPPLKIGYACTNVMASDGFPLLDSKQICGMLIGLKGAADYEFLVNEKEKLVTKLRYDPRSKITGIEQIISASALKLMTTQSNAHLIIIILILLGNIGYFLTRKQKIPIPEYVPPVEDDEETQSRKQFFVNLFISLTSLIILTACVYLSRKGMINDMEKILGVLASLAVFSIVFRDNPAYRFVEHIFVGLATGYGIVITWTQFIIPKWYTAMMPASAALPNGEGKWWLAMALVCGLMFYTVYFTKLAWINRLAIGILMGWSAGAVFKGFAGLMGPQLVAAFRPPITSYAPENLQIIQHSPDAMTKFSAIHIGGNFYFYPLETIAFIVLISVMSYFFFTINHKHEWIKKPANLGKYFMMITLGVIFGNTVMSRFSLLIGRLEFIRLAFQEWIHRIFF